MSNNPAFLYWIHHQDHTDILSQGYVGFTSKQVKKRIAEHTTQANKQYGRSIHLEKAIRKYGIDGLIVKTLCIGSADYCLEIERKLRPKHGIGWNLAIGGDKPAIGRIVSVETRKKLSASSKRLIMSESAKKKISEKAKGNTRRLGKVLTQEHKDKIRKKLLGRKASAAQRDNLKKARNDPAYKASVSEKMKWNWKYNPNMRRKISVPAP